MFRLKRVGSAVAAGAIFLLTPIAAHADCNGCFNHCMDVYGADNSETGLYWLAACMSVCTDDLGKPCMSGAGGNG